MIDFLIKSSLCLILLLGIYHFFLEKEKMSVFNRFYLLGSLVISFLIPFLKFELQQDILQNNLLPNAIKTIQGSTIIVNQNTNNFSIILWIFYGIITAFFAARFGRNIFEFIYIIKTNSLEKFENATLVLVKEKILPHTFLNYIFINKNDYENRKIEGELFAHELTHVRQKHTLDVLFIEILKTLFWFNPILIYYKKAIQLNHEFLADENVVKSYNNVPFYQSLLLEKASWNSNFYLASNLNFLVTKKRLIMMTKKTSQSTALLKKLAVLPVLAGLILISCTESSEITSENQTKKTEKAQVWQVESEYESLPEFPGGLDGFGKFIQKNYKIPKDFVGEGSIFINMIVESDGSLSNIKVVKDLGFGTGEEALRILKISPKWQPALLDGKAVRIEYVLPIKLVSK